MIKTDVKPKVIDGINLYLNAGWGEPNDYINLVQVYENAYENSFFITAFFKEKLIGMIRYLSDGFHDTQILECIVLKSYQKQGVCKNMLNKLKELYPQSVIYILSTESHQDIFVQEGFKKHQLVGMSYFKGKV